MNFFPFLYKKAKDLDFYSPFLNAKNSVPQAKIFEGRLGYPAISMNLKTESFIYVTS